jgi:hypothetical protein
MYVLLTGLYFTKLSCTFPKEIKTESGEDAYGEGTYGEGAYGESGPGEGAYGESGPGEGAYGESGPGEGAYGVLEPVNLIRKYGYDGYAGGGKDDPLDDNPSYFTKLLRKYYFWHKIKYNYKNFNNNTFFNDTNPYKNLKSKNLKKDKCKLFICKNAYTHNNYNNMISKYLGYDIGNKTNYSSNDCIPENTNSGNYQPPSGVSKLIISTIDYLLGI